MSNNVPQPLFAPSSNQQQLGDDIDLNEIFADYFINEFEDPLNAYTNSMANYSGGAAAVALAQKQEEVNAAAAPLPTGGIKTTFHAAPASAPPVGEPLAKRMKEEATASAGRGDLSGRLGYPMVGGSMVMGNQAPPPVPPQPVAAAAPPSASSSGVLPLPVGIGIKLGGVGGVSPSTAQSAARPPPASGQYMMWAGQNATGGMSESAIAERRQRNREHAKRSRVRKKFMLESLQEQVSLLQKENMELRMLIQEKIPAHAQVIITECCSKNPLFEDPDFMNPAEAEATKRKETDLVKSDFTLMESLTSGQQNFVLSDPRLPDNPIVYASPGFYSLTGYTQEQVLGRNCRFLQGPGTDPRTIDIIRKAVASGSDATTCILNYKADGTPFWNQFFVAALRDADNCIVNYVGVQCEVEPEAGSSALEDKVNQVLPLQDKGGEAAIDGDSK